MNRTAQDSIAFDFTDEACSIDGQALRLNGFGIRKLFLVEVYRVHMFSVNSIETRDQLQPGEPVRFAIRFSYGPISSDRMKQAWLDAFKKNVPDEELHAHQEVADAFLNSIRDYQKHDVVVYDLGDQDVKIYTNNEHIMTIKSDVVCRWIADVFIGDKPIDDSVKKGLLSGR